MGKGDDLKPLNSSRSNAKLEISADLQKSKGNLLRKLDELGVSKTEQLLPEIPDSKK